MSLPNTYVALDSHDILAWTLDEATPPWANTGTAGSLNMGTSASAAVLPKACTGLYSTGGPYTGAVLFPGNNATFNYIDTGASGTTLGESANDITVSCFVRLSDYANGSLYGMIVNKSYRPDTVSWASPYHSVALFYNNTNNGQIVADVIISGTEYTLVPNYKIPLGRWVHIGLTFEKSTGILQVYADGTLLGFRTTVAATGVDWGTHGPWTIGGEHDGATSIHGAVDDVRVADIVRPASYFQSFGAPNKNAYVATDASDQLVYTLDESAPPYANSGTLGALSLNIESGGSGVVSQSGLFNSGAWIPGPSTSLNFLTSGAAGTTTGEYGTNFTLSGWVWLRDYQPGSFYGLFFGKAYRPDASGWTSPFLSHRVGYANTNDGTLIYNVVIAGTYYEVRPSTKIPLHQWCHVGYTWDGLTLKCYLSGLQIAAYIPTGVGGQSVDYGTHGAWIVGGTPSGTGLDTINGIIDDIRLANVVRDEVYFGQMGYFDFPTEQPAPSLAVAEAFTPDLNAKVDLAPGGGPATIGGSPFPVGFKRLNSGLDSP